jgi:hypothetical protein
MSQEPWYEAHFSGEAAEAAYVLRVTRDPILALRALGAIAQETERLIHVAVTECRELGHSWTEVAEALHVSKQAAHRRFQNDDPQPKQP